MKLTIFYADKGDCLLVTSRDGRSILCDGGMPAAFPRFVAPVLRQHLPPQGNLDVVYVSHIDEDHIGGVLALLDQAFDWKIFHLHRKAGDNGFKAPAVPEPPSIKNLWHNAFHELVKDNLGEIRDLLAANALGLRLIDASWARGVGASSANLVNSIPQAMSVSRRASKDQLDIPLNKPAGGKLMLRRTSGNETKVGTMTLTTIGPAQADVDRLRTEWNKWLEDQKNRTTLKSIQDRADADEARLRNTMPPADAARFAAAAKRLGDRNKVTPPNLASLMFHAEDGGRTVLLTGDGHSVDVEAGLESTGHLAKGKGLHVDVLKVPHHGSEHNTTKTFPRRVTADHYVFCGNGFSGNPDPVVLKAYLDSRLGAPGTRSPNNEASRAFTFWFNCDSALVPAKFKSHMKKVETLVKNAVQNSQGKLRVHFLKNDPLVLDLG